jgi:hypothetical protein
MNDNAPYSIGSNRLEGMSKLIEEMGELQQVLGKLMGNGGEDSHWDGTNLYERLAEECADLEAALDFFTSKNARMFSPVQYTKRYREKLELFQKWSKQQRSLPTKESSDANLQPIQPESEPVYHYHPSVAVQRIIDYRLTEHNAKRDREHHILKRERDA